MALTAKMENGQIGPRVACPAVAGNNLDGKSATEMNVKANCKWPGLVIRNLAQTGVAGAIGHLVRFLVERE